MKNKRNRFYVVPLICLAMILVIPAVGLTDDSVAQNSAGLNDHVAGRPSGA